MDLQLQFAQGKMLGDGIDDIGPLVIKGRFDAPNRECYWTKTYVGGHEVYNRGFREYYGIWDIWEIIIINLGGFHIWPRHQGDDTEPFQQQTDPIDAISTHSATPGRSSLL